jgi:fluoroquinolone transport system permease protein
MNLRAITHSLGPIDWRSIRRDNLLSWMILMPIIITLLLRLALPPIQARILALTGFDLAAYYPVILAIYIVMLTPMLFGMLAGFLLLDEMDNNTLQALQVTPMPMSTYLGYRILVPMALSFVLTFLIYPLINLAPMRPAHLMLMALEAAPAGPLLALFIANFASNKVQGFALLKGLGGVLMLPVVAFFLAEKWQIFFGLLPTYWPIKVYWQLLAGDAVVWPYLVIGLVYQIGLMGLLLRRFTLKMHR